MMKFSGLVSVPKTFSISWTKKAVIFLICLVANLTLTSHVKADEIVVTVNGNGSDSSNQVQVSSQNNTQVSQNNNSNIDNNVTSNSNTGNNTTSNNANGSASVTTGEVNSSTTVNNQNINTNNANTDCGCQNNSSTYIIGNGADSTNVAVNSNSTSIVVGQNNTAYISNNITANANTGYNKASYNGSSTSITTGNIFSSTTINNKNINNSAYFGSNGLGNSLLMISGNGEGSLNNAYLTTNVSVVVANTNLASITNNVENNLNTGGNTTLGNLGDSAIVTGGIVNSVTINNENINSSFFEIACDCSKPENPEPPTTPSTPTPGTSYVQGSSGSSSSGSSNGTPGNVLPMTGSTIPWSLFATLIFFFMFISGLYLRFHGANAPPSRV